MFWANAADRPYVQELGIIHDTGWVAVARYGGPGAYGFSYAYGASRLESAKQHALAGNGGRIEQTCYVQ